MPRPLILIGVLVSISLAAGCATKDSVLPNNLPSIRQIYDAHQQRTRQSTSGASYRVQARPLSPALSELEGYTRTAYTEHATVFPVLPNPPLIMYVYPHLAGDDGVGIPGYSTAFSFYETTQYALPGEVPERLPALGPEIVPASLDSHRHQVRQRPDAIKDDAPLVITGSEQ